MADSKRGGRVATPKTGGPGSGAPPAQPMGDTLEALSKAIGARIKLTTAAPHSQTLEGSLFTACPTLNVLAINTRPASSGANAATQPGDYHIIPVSRIQTFQIVSLASEGENSISTAQPAVAPVDLKRLKEREQTRIRQLKEEEGNRGKGVSKEGQAIFDALKKINVPIRWHNQEMIVHEAVIVAPPYRSEDCKGSSQRQQVLNQVKKMLEGERRKLKEREEREKKTAGAAASAGPRKGGTATAAGSPTRKTPPSPPFTPTLLGLPTFIRGKIYALLFHRTRTLSLRTLRPPPLALVSRLLFAEVSTQMFHHLALSIAVPVLFGDHTLTTETKGPYSGFNIPLPQWTQSKRELRSQLAFTAHDFCTGATAWMALAREGKGVALGEVKLCLQFPLPGSGRKDASVRLKWDVETCRLSIVAELPFEEEDVEEAGEVDLGLCSTAADPACDPVPPTPSWDPYELSSPVVMQSREVHLAAGPEERQLRRRDSHVSSRPPSYRTVPSVYSTAPLPWQNGFPSRSPGLTAREFEAASRGFEDLCVVAANMTARRGFEGFTLSDLDVLGGCFGVERVV